MSETDHAGIAKALRAAAARKRTRAKEYRVDAVRLDDEAATLEAQAKDRDRKAAEAIPVDRSAQVLTTGEPVPQDRSHTEPEPHSGQQKAYVVLTEAERAKGFVRPVREAYKHLTCGAVTSMSRDIAETYARDPSFYSGTWCTTCRGHFPVGEDGEFTWVGSAEKVGT